MEDTFLRSRTHPEPTVQQSHCLGAYPQELKTYTHTEASHRCLDQLYSELPEPRSNQCASGGQRINTMPPDYGVLLVLKENELACHGKTRLLLKGTSLSERSTLKNLPAVCCAGIPRERAVQPVQACAMARGQQEGGRGRQSTRGFKAVQTLCMTHSGEDTALYIGASPQNTHHRRGPRRNCGVRVC